MLSKELAPAEQFQLLIDLGYESCTSTNVWMCHCWMDKCDPPAIQKMSAQGVLQL